MTTLCAWCRDARAAKGLPPVMIRQDDQPPLDQVSHGMCDLCAAAALGVPPGLLEHEIPEGARLETDRQIRGASGTVLVATLPVCPISSPTVPGRSTR